MLTEKKKGINYIIGEKMNFDNMYRKDTMVNINFAYSFANFQVGKA